MNAKTRSQRDTPPLSVQLAEARAVIVRAAELIECMPASPAERRNVRAVAHIASQYTLLREGTARKAGR